MVGTTHSAMNTMLLSYSLTIEKTSHKLTVHYMHADMYAREYIYTQVYGYTFYNEHT